MSLFIFLNFIFFYGAALSEQNTASPKEPPPPPPPEVPWKETPGDVVHLSAETFKQELKRKKHALVMFYAPWCGHCKAAKPEFSAAATTFKDEGRVLFGAVDCTEDNELCTEYGVEGFPTIMYFSYLKHSEPYPGGRQKDDFEVYISKMASLPLGGTPAEPEQLPVEEKPKDDWDLSVKILTPETFDSELAKANRAMVMFFAPWCGHCKKAKPEFSQAAVSLKDDSSKVLCALDCSAYQEFCKEKEVKGYPTFKIYESGKFAKDHTGGKAQTDFLSALVAEREAAPPKVEEGFWPPEMTLLTPDIFETTLARVKRSLVMFYAPWCGHCKRAKPEFAAASAAVQEQEGKLLAALDCAEHSAFCREKGVRGYPTFQHFENGKFLGKYTGGRTKEAFIDGLSVEMKAEEPTVTTPPPKPAEPTVAPKVEEGFWPPEMTLLTPENFETTLSGVKRSLVMFYAPWCGHCKRAKPEFSAAADAVRTEDGKLLAAVDCTAHGGKDLKAFCREKGVGGYPTFQHFENGKFIRKYTGGRTKDAFMEGLSVDLKAEEKPAKPPPPVKKEEDWSPSVKLVTPDNFQTVLGEVKVALVMFYAPWCGHCKKAKPEFSQAANAIHGDTNKALAAMDCTVHREFCVSTGVKGFPTFQIFENGKFARAYTGGRTKDGFIDAVSLPKKTEL